ncbi:polyisoprenoid-binding protein [Bordetella genomosp. 9]|uniref:Polyisoprenoid-binding protein n=1 Tax=Bordetella genomosp. 9 TaxID=1416803 RepID=A0A261R6J8_9BORD|nr:YceI family protein [Bordetella genomosp. 9]OZI19973.1 polyisoprenoid-binding protein [Bordetella genomosp. 9]
MRFLTPSRAAIAACVLPFAALAEPVTYQLDPDHTYPSFEADHFAGASIWRGKFDKTSGTVVLDAQAGTGTVDVTIDLASVNTGNKALDDQLRGDKFFDVKRFPTAAYKGSKVHFKDGKPVEVDGTFTLHGVSHPLKLTLLSFKCYENPIMKKQVCGTEATAAFDRDAYGVSFGKEYGFFMKTTLHIQAEGIRQ